jgi:hypothetical protein
LNKNTTIILVIIISIVLITGLLFVLTQFSTNKTSNNTNNSTILNNTVSNNSTISNQTQNQNNNPPPPPTEISSDKSKELAQKYAGPGTTLGKPVLTTYKKVKVWQVPVYTMDHKFINNIYIDVRTGEKVN